MKKWLVGLLRVFLVLTALLPIGYAVTKDWPIVRETLAHIHPQPLLVGMAILVFSIPLMGLISHLSLRHLQVSRPAYLIGMIYFVSQLAKYLPGGIWAYPGRMLMYERAGVARVPAIISVSREVIVLFLGAAAVGGLGLLGGLPLPVGMQAVIGLAVVGSFGAVMVLQVPHFWDLLGRIPFLRRLAVSSWRDSLANAGTRWLLDTFLVSLLYWLVTGWGFRWLVLAVYPGAMLSWLQAASIFALAWCMGFVIVFLPAGFGAREAVLLLLLAGIMPNGAAASLALLSRLWWMAAEAVWVAISLVFLPAVIRTKPRQLGTAVDP